MSAFLLAAALRSRKPADHLHMFGYGRAQNVAALVAATLFISFTSLKLYEEATPRLLKTEAAHYENIPVALGVLVASMVVAAAPLVQLIRQRKRGAAAKAQLLGLVNDELGLVAALAGTLLVMWRVPIADPIATVAVATIIAYNAVQLFRENVSFLLGRSPGPEFLAELEELARSVSGVLGVHDVRAEYVGPDTVHAGLHIELAPASPIEEADRIAEDVKDRISRATGCQHCVVHMDPSGNAEKLQITSTKLQEDSRHQAQLQR